MYKILGENAFAQQKRAHQGPTGRDRVEWPYAAAQQLYCLKYNVV